MLVTKDEGLKNYLNNVLKQLRGRFCGPPPSFDAHLLKLLTYGAEWLMTGTVQKLVVVVTNTDTNITMERWVFDIITELPQSGGYVQPRDPKCGWCASGLISTSAVAEM